MNHSTHSFQRALRFAPWLVVAAGLLGFALMTMLRASSVASSIRDDVVGLVFGGIGLVGFAILMWRLKLVASYRPVPAPPAEALPGVTVVVPAYNEGRQVYDTVASVVASAYPPDRLHVVAVDDGSRDDTALWIRRAQRDFGATAVFCPENRGKRHALYEGFARARGEVVVTVDSDSEVQADTLSNLVAPLVVDPRVGAVAGVVRVMNRKGAIPRMLDVSFTYAFEFIRASESVLGAVVCCPGALSAYRRSVLEEVKDEWLEQRIFGRPANIGEDRALTNQMLRRGLHVVLQSNAPVLTKVPTRFDGLRKMLLRWARSNVRESLVLGGFVFKSFRNDHLGSIRLLYVHHAAAMILAGLAFPMTIAAILMQPTLLGWVVLASLVAASVPSAIYATRRHPEQCLWGFAYGLLSTFGISWITPWALLTPHRTGWLTRQL